MVLSLREQAAYTIYRDADIHGVALPRTRCLDIADQVLTVLLGDPGNLPQLHTALAATAGGRDGDAPPELARAAREGVT